MTDNDTFSHADFNDAPASAELLARVDEIIASLSLEEKVYMMSGQDFFERFFGEDKRTFGLRPYQAGSGNERLNISPLKFADGPRGVRVKENTTCFPVAMARGASWNPDLEEEIGNAIGIECRASGVTLSGAVCVNILRHPAWGRAQETYGEDSHLLGQMGASLTRGIQRHNVMATVKHFALNSIENSRFYVDIIVDERSLREVYLPHFKTVLDAGCATVMSAYNQVNGKYCAHNRQLLTDILRNEWGFQGFVHSDWVKGVYGTDAVEAGLDIENPEGIFFGKNLVKDVVDGKISEELIDQSIRRILSTQFRFAEAPDQQSYSVEDISCEKHKSLAYQSAEQSMTLLKNDSLLPLDKNSINSLVVVGRLANIENLGDHGSSRVNPPYCVTLLEGLRNRIGPQGTITYLEHINLPQDEQTISTADAIIIVDGYTFEDEGEFIPGNEAMEGLDSDKKMTSRGGDRDTLALPQHCKERIQKICALNSKTLVAIMSGSAVMMNSWEHDPAAIMLTWYPGMEGGNAFADLVFGTSSPSGRLPFSIPNSENDLPFFDKNAKQITYEMYNGYTLLEKQNTPPRFPFGFGLTYSKFEYSQPRLVSLDGQSALIEIDLKNTGDHEAAEVTQLYLSPINSKVDRPVKRLNGFKKTRLRPSQVKTVSFNIPNDGTPWFDTKTSAWVKENIPSRIYIGSDCQEAMNRSIDLNWPASCENDPQSVFT